MKIECLQSKAFIITIPILVSIGTGLIIYFDDYVNDIQALALENKSTLDKREQAIEQDIPEIKQELKTMSSNVIKLCVVIGAECE
jgi:hypothetical protein